MNGMFSNYWGIPATPQQNVQQYVNMPVASTPTQSQPQMTMADFVRAFQPKQEDTFGNNPAIRHIAGLPPLEQQANQQPSKSEQILLHLAGLSPNQK